MTGWMWSTWSLTPPRGSVAGAAAAGGAAVVVAGEDSPAGAEGEGAAAAFAARGFAAPAAEELEQESHHRSPLGASGEPLHLTPRGPIPCRLFVARRGGCAAFVSGIAGRNRTRNSGKFRSA